MYQVNLLAVLVAGVAAWLVGALWYSSLMFGKSWMKLAKLEDIRPNPVVYLAGIAVYLVTAYVFAHVMAAFQATSVLAGLMGGFWLWLGFVATQSLSSVLYENKPFKLYLLNNGYNLISYLVIGAIIAGWR